MKESRVYLIQCKKCHNRMKYMTSALPTTFSTKKKRCVYCGFTNSVASSIVLPNSNN